VVANRLLNTPTTAAVHDHYFVNYGLLGGVVSAPGGNELRMAHRGNVFGILKQGWLVRLLPINIMKEYTYKNRPTEN
jgi:hypothetical protein